MNSFFTKHGDQDFSDDESWVRLKVSEDSMTIEELREQTQIADENLRNLRRYL